jgi:hypothetical protein
MRTRLRTCSDGALLGALRRVDFLRDALHIAPQVLGALAFLDLSRRRVHRAHRNGEGQRDKCDLPHAPSITPAGVRRCPIL